MQTKGEKKPDTVFKFLILFKYAINQDKYIKYDASGIILSFINNSNILQVQFI